MGISTNIYLIFFYFFAFSIVWRDGSCCGPLHPAITSETWDTKCWVGRSWEMGLWKGKLEHYCFSVGKKDFFQASWRRGDHTYGLNSWEGCFWPLHMGIRNLPWPKPCGIFQSKRKEVINGKYWALCKYFAPLRCQWQILCGILCVRW